MKFLLYSTLVLLATLLVACERSPQSGHGMVLPQGDLQGGQAAFVSLGCTECHSVAGVDLPVGERDMAMNFELGGKIVQVRTYGELVTAITNPQHGLSPKATGVLTREEIEIGESPMPYFNDRMTVEQLIDLVSFLGSRYERLRPEYVGYHYVN